MQKDYIYTLPSIIYICLACLSLILVLLIWRKRNTPGAKPTSLFFLALFIWAFAYIFESAATNVEGKLLWSQIAYLGTLSTPMLFLAFSQEYCNRRLIHKPYAWILLGIIPMATFILAWTNNSHHLVWTDITIQGNQHLAVYGHGIAFWVFFIYAYILIILSLGYLIFTAFRLHKIYRQQAISTSIAVSFVVAGNILYMIPSNPIPGMEWTLLGFLLCSLILSYNILGLKLFNLVPIARTHLVDTMTSGMLLVDKAGRIKDINQSFLSHLNIQNIDYLGQPYSEVLCNTPELIDMLSDKNVFENQKISEFHHHDQILDVRISDLASKNHKMTGRLLLINDITDLKQAEQSLQKTNKLLSDQIENSNKLILELDAYAHTVAHDLKIPLNSLVGFSELLTEELQSGNSELAGKYSTQITSSADKMVQIIEELLLLSSVRSQSVELQSLNIGKSVGLAQDRISELIKASKTVIKQPDQWPEVIGYEPWIVVIWVNYLSNAIKYGGDPPEITIGYDESPEVIWFWVKDNGAGLNKDQLNQLFKPYSRLSPHTADGHGLGLSIVKRILEKLRGDYNVKTLDEGNGSVFLFSLPRISG